MRYRKKLEEINDLRKRLHEFYWKCDMSMRILADEIGVSVITVQIFLENPKRTIRSMVRKKIENFLKKNENFKEHENG